jgi:hypothetical protein
MGRKPWLRMLAGWLLSATCAWAGEPYFLKTREMEIPVKLPGGGKGEVEKLILFVSADNGKTWKQEATTIPAPGEMKFPFIAPADGAYLLNVAFVNRQGKMEPPDIGAVPPQMSVIVDTQRPIVKLQVTDRQADQITVSWEVRDAHLDVSSLRLEYRTSEQSPWRPLALPTGQTSGQKRFTVGTSGPVELQLTARDKAENQGSVVIESPGVALAASGATPAATVQQSQPLPLPDPPTLVPPPPPGNSPPATTFTPVPSSPPAAVDPFRPAPPTLPAVAPPPATTASPVAPLTPAPALPAPAASLPGAGNGSPPAAAGSSAAGSSSDPQPKVIASSNVPAASSAPPTPPVAPTAVGPRGPLPPLNFVNQTHLELDYEIPRQGPSGISVVELWVTQDNGQTWHKHKEKTDPLPPFAFDLPGEGQYGFLLIVRSGAGLGRSAPQKGEYPELRIEVDTTPPAAQLFPVEADPRRRDYLFFNWKAEDKNLGATPVSLYWAEKREGPWQVIAVDQPNTGRLPWKMPPELPYQIYLRLQVRDQAGNVSIAETSNPVLVDLTEPEVKIKGLVGGARPPK